jgi:hypothetical protein
MMVPKTYRDPGSETLATFAFASLGGALAAGAVGAPDLSLLLYPVYYCLVNGAIVLLIRHRRGVLRSLEPSSPPAIPPGIMSPEPANALHQGVKPPECLETPLHRRLIGQPSTCSTPGAEPGRPPA